MNYIKVKNKYYNVSQIVSIEYTKSMRTNLINSMKLTFSNNAKVYIPVGNIDEWGSANLDSDLIYIVKLLLSDKQNDNLLDEINKEIKLSKNNRDY